MSITKEQRTIIATLSFGTFLEYFDLMLYVHTSIILNDLFFPKTSTLNPYFLSSIAFCSVFIFRPIGAIVLGYIGDTVGRKTTIFISTIMTAISCIIIANLPTYDQIGITATVILTLCRLIQGISSVGESVGAEIYLTETMSPPEQYPGVALVTIFAALGGIVALCIACFIVSFNFNWRIAFWIGAGIAIAGSIVRSNFKETADFIDKKTHQYENDTLSNNGNKAAALAFFLIQCAYPACFYLVYIHCGDVLKQSFGYTNNEVIYQNLVVSVIQILGFIFLATISYKIHPLKIVKARLIIFLLFIFIVPYLLSHANSPVIILLVQSLVVLFWLGDSPATPIFLKHFSTLKRFTYASLVFAFSRALMYVGSSLSLVYVIENCGYWILSLLMAMISIGFWIGFRYFERLEKSQMKRKDLDY